MNVILIGGGKTIYFLSHQILDKGHELTVVNEDQTEARRLSEKLEALVICGDGSDARVLEEAGARRADVVLALTPRDQDNLVACQLARQMYGVPHTLAVVNDPENEELLSQLGVTQTFSATRLIASMLEQQLGFEEVYNVLTAVEGQINVTEVTLRPGSPAIGQRLQELSLPADSLIGCIIRHNQVIVPSGENHLKIADRLLLVTLPDSHEETLRILLGEEE